MNESDDAPVGRDDAPPDTEAVLERLLVHLENARSMPLSSSVMVNREEFAELLREGLEGLPEELRLARHVLKERDEVLVRADREAERIIEAARTRAERMVEKTEVVREARRRSDMILEEAEAGAARIRNEAEDYVDHKLAAFEVVLDRTMQTVRRGRERLQVQVPEAELSDDEELPDLFDQDDT